MKFWIIIAFVVIELTQLNYAVKCYEKTGVKDCPYCQISERFLDGKKITQQECLVFCLSGYAYTDEGNVTAKCCSDKYGCKSPHADEYNFDSKGSNCPQGYKMFQNNCYRLFTDRKQFTDAERDCSNQRGHLLSVHNKEELEFLRYNQMTQGKPFIGLNDKAVEGLLVWSDGSPLDYELWAGQKPNSFTVEDCIQMNTEGTWVLANCEVASNYVCKIRL